MTGAHDGGKRVLVTGATGFVGGAVARALLQAGHSVTGVVRSPERAGDLRDAGAELLGADMREPATYQDEVAEVDAVVHAAQLTTTGRLTTKKMEEMRAADGVASETLAAACTRHGRRLVYTSGCFNWGDRGTEWIDEDTPLNPSPLGVGHTRESERLLARHAADGLDVVIVAPGFVYGPGGLFRSAFTEQLERGRLRVIGNGRNYWSCVQVDDLARAFVLALERGHPGRQYLAVDDEPLPLRALVDQLCDAAGRKRVGRVPAAAMGLLIGRPLVTSLVASFRMRNTRAREELGWAPEYPRFADGVGPALAGLGIRPAGAAS